MGPTNVIGDDGPLRTHAYAGSQIGIQAGFGKKVLAQIARRVGMEDNRAVRGEYGKLKSPGQDSVVERDRLRYE